MDPKRVRIVAVVIVVILVVAGIGVYYYVTHRSTSCSLASRNPLVIDQAETPDSLDPAVTFSTPGWASVYGVYQPLVMYNGSSYTTFVGVLAHNWSESSDGFHWNFSLRQGVHFSNGDPFNAYTMWFSLYRGLVMNQGPEFILGQNFFFPGLNYYSNATQAANEQANVTNDLNSWDFLAPTPSEIAVMEAPNQSFQVLNASVLELNLGFGYLGAVPYTYLLPSIVSPIAAAVDPTVVQANGKVSANVNSWMSGNMIGTGPYVFAGGYSPDVSTGLLLTPDPNYWGASLAMQEPWNNVVQPAQAGINTVFQGESSIDVQDLKSGHAAAASFAYIGPSTVSALQNTHCVSATALPIVFGATSGSWFIYMNQSTAPFNNWSVRAAVTHAIDYNQIIQSAFGGYASQWVGPVPPSYPDYNPNQLPNSSFNVTLALAEMANSPWPHGFSNPLNYEYVNTPAWADVALLLKADLAKIGITINPVPISLAQLYVEQRVDKSTGVCTAQEAVQGGPFPIGQEFYTSDYISPDDWTQNVAISYGSANQCMSGYANSTVDGLVIQAAGEHNAANATKEYGQITQMMYANYTDVWLCVPTSFAVTNTGLQGVILNPMGSAIPYVMLYNTYHGT